MMWKAIRRIKRQWPSCVLWIGLMIASSMTAAAAGNDLLVAGVQLAEKGRACTPQAADPATRHAVDGYLLTPEFTRRYGSVSPHRLETGAEMAPERLLSVAKSEGCAVVLADAERIGLLVAELISNRANFDALPPQAASETIGALVRKSGLERHEQLLVLEALPARGDAGDVRLLSDAGVTSPEQLTSLGKKIIDSGYAAQFDIDTLRGYLSDQREGAAQGKSAVQILKGRQAAEAAAEKARVEAEVERTRKEERAATWEKVKSWATGIAVVVGAVLIAWLVAGTSSQCPACQKWFAAQRLQTSEIGRTTGFETETREDKVRVKGEVVATIERKEQVQVTHVHYQHLNQCKFCSHQWLSQSSQKYKG